MTTKFRKLTIRERYTGEPFEVLVDLQSPFEGRDSDGDLLIRTWKAYGRPQHGRWLVGYFGVNEILTAPTDYIPILRIGELREGTDNHTIENHPIYREKHPQRYGQIVSAWAKADA